MSDRPDSTGGNPRLDYRRRGSPTSKGPSTEWISTASLPSRERSHAPGGVAARDCSPALSVTTGTHVQAVSRIIRLATRIRGLRSCAQAFGSAGGSRKHRRSSGRRYTGRSPSALCTYSSSRAGISAGATAGGINSHCRHGLPPTFTRSFREKLISSLGCRSTSLPSRAQGLSRRQDIVRCPSNTVERAVGIRWHRDQADRTLLTTSIAARQVIRRAEPRGMWSRNGQSSTSTPYFDRSRYHQPARVRQGCATIPEQLNFNAGEPWYGGRPPRRK